VSAHIRTAGNATKGSETPPIQNCVTLKKAGLVARASSPDPRMTSSCSAGAAPRQACPTSPAVRAFFWVGWALPVLAAPGAPRHQSRRDACWAPFGLPACCCSAIRMRLRHNELIVSRPICYGDWTRGVALDRPQPLVLALLSAVPCRDDCHQDCSASCRSNPGGGGGVIGYLSPSGLGFFSFVRSERVLILVLIDCCITTPSARHPIPTTGTPPKGFEAG